MGCCLSKKSLSNGSSSCVVKPVSNKPVPENPVIEEAKPITITISEKLHHEEENTTAVIIKQRRSHEKPEESPVVCAAAVEKPVDSVPVVMSCTKEEEVDAILIQCGKMSRNNSAAKTRRYSGSKRSFDFDQNEKIQAGGDAEEHRNRRERVNGSPRERRRRTPSRERDDSKSYRSGSRERGGGGSGGGGRRVSRSPGKRSDSNPNPNSSGNSVNSSNIRLTGKFVTVPATEKSNNNNGEPLIKRITTVKRNIGEACRTAASPRSKSPVVASNSQQQPPPPSLSRSSSRKAEQSPYRRNPLAEIDQNSSKPNPRKKTIRASSPQVISRSRSLRKSRDFDFSPETLLLLSNEENKNKNNNNASNYTALLLKDIQSFHGKSNNVDEDPFDLVPSCVTKACSIVEAVADLNSTTTTSLSSDSNQFRFTSKAKKADLMEPSFEKLYVTVKRGGGSLEESSGSNNLT